MEGQGEDWNERIKCGGDGREVSRREYEEGQVALTYIFKDHVETYWCRSFLKYKHI